MTQASRVGWFRKALWHVGGIWGPLACFAIELVTHMCRDALFDPIPTPWHALLVLTVPLSMYLALRALDRPELCNRALGYLLGCAACISLLYAVPFVPLLPLSLLFSVAGIGLLGLAPLLAPIAVLSLAAEFRIRAGDPGGRKLAGTWTGFLGCVALLALLDLGPARTILAVQRYSSGPEDAENLAWIRDHGHRDTLEQIVAGWRVARPLAYLVYSSCDLDAEKLRRDWTRVTGEPLPARLEFDRFD